MTTPDWIVVGAGSAGCVVAARLAKRGRVTVIEAGRSDRHPLVQLPFGLVWMIGSDGWDWRYKTTPQAGLDGRQLNVPRGRMLGGSGSINSMVWFRGRKDDFDTWNVPGWSWADVEHDFEAIEAVLQPVRYAEAHPMVPKLTRALPTKDGLATPERPSAGALRYNMSGGRRRSAAKGFLRPAMARHGVEVLTGKIVDRVGFENGMARSVHFADGASLSATKGVVLSAGSIGTPAILLRSGIGPSADLKTLGIDVVLDAPEVGANLHDHPGVGLHFKGAGYGLSAGEALSWAAAPVLALMGRGRFTSPTVEGGAFFRVGDGDGPPDIQTHLIPYFLDWRGRKYAYGTGFFADVCVCRPRSRGRLSLSSTDPRVQPSIDFGLLSDPSDTELLVRGLIRLRQIIADSGIAAKEEFPGLSADLTAHVRDRAGTAYHPVGTVRMGTDAAAPLTPDLAVRGLGGLWVADASVMPCVTSANTNAPSMMIGHRAATFIGDAA